MTTQEFSNEFDVLYGNIVTPNAPALDEYEKSVFLTKAQSEILREYFNSRVDGTNGGFDGSQKRQYDFSQLITTTTLQNVIEYTPSSGDITPLGGITPSEYIKPTLKIDKRSLCYKFPKDYFLSVNEIISDTKRQYSVISISYSDYQRLMTKPYTYPSKNSVWRLFTSTVDNVVATQTTEADSTLVPLAEIIGKFEGSIEYHLRYVKKPSPIILVDITNDNLSIEGESAQTECQLPSEIHQEILERAVTLAKIAYQAGSTSSIVAQQQQQERNNRR